MSYGSGVLFGAGHTPVAAMVGVEQPITDGFWLAADWHSGDHALGAFMPAAQFHVGRFAIIAGYKLDNHRARPRDAVILEVMALR